jgi:predicted nucleotidyltransferase
MDLKEMLEQEFHIKVDLVTHKSLKPHIREEILREAVRVA